MLNILRDVPKLKNIKRYVRPSKCPKPPQIIDEIKKIKQNNSQDSQIKREINNEQNNNTALCNYFKSSCKESIPRDDQNIAIAP